MNQKETPVQFHTNLFEHGLCKYFDVGLWNCSECLHYSDTEPRCILGYIVHCASLCVYLCPTRYDSTSWWGQRSLINLAHHLLLEANHWRYKGVLYKQSRMCRTQCSQNTSSNPAKSRLQQPSLGGVGICLYCILFIFFLSLYFYYINIIKKRTCSFTDNNGRDHGLPWVLADGLAPPPGLVASPSRPSCWMRRRRTSRCWTGSTPHWTECWLCRQKHRSTQKWDFPFISLRPDQFNTVHNPKRSQYVAIYKSLANGCC